VDGLAVLGNIEARPKRGKVIADLLGRVGHHLAHRVDDHLRRRQDR
jgi:hypothetical protein